MSVTEQNDSSRDGMSPAAPTAGASVLLSPVPLGASRITRGFWFERAETNRNVTVPAGEAQLETAKNLTNLRVVAGQAEGAAHGPIFADSDVHKWLEAAAWEYGRRNSEGLMESMLVLTQLLEDAQAEDGYLNSVVQLRHDKRYQDLPWSHEHYCAGHLIQAAVAYSRSTGRTELIDVAVRFADHLVDTFGPGKLEDVDGHPVIEMALVELYRETGQQKYLDLATWFVEARGRGIIEGHGFAPAYFSDRVSVREAETVEGHAVRAVYLAAGATDVAVETNDTTLLEALKNQYRAMQRTKQYITGGLGARWEGESFGDPYELPTDRGYAETCAAIGGIQWAWRLLLATGDPNYADQIELMLYNGFLAGVSLSGSEFFYVNPLQLRSDALPDEDRSPAHGRRGWFDCACCPPNVMRMFSSLEGYLATTRGNGIQIHQYMAGDLTGGGLRLKVETSYPWTGTVTITVAEAAGCEREVSLRIPAWAEGATLNSEPVQPGTYASVKKLWSVGDRISLELPMEAQFVHADHRVDAVRGCVALQRGPLVYAFEQGDQADGVVIDDLQIDVTQSPPIEYRDDLLGGVVVIKACGATVRPPSKQVKSPFGSQDPVSGDTAVLTGLHLTAIPYYAWANRGPQPMRVWVPVLSSGELAGK